LSDIISDELWQQNDVLIENLNIPFLHRPISQTLNDLETELENLNQRVNRRITTGENKDINITGSGEHRRWHLPYHNDQEPVDHPIFSHLPQLGIIDVILFVPLLRMPASLSTGTPGVFLLLPIS
jgi:hypothetical protein